MTITKLHAIRLVALIAPTLLFLASCGSAPKPSDEEVTAFLTQPLGGQFTVALNQAESFIDRDTAQGRISVSGALVASADMFVSMNQTDVIEAYGKLGVPADHLEFIRSLQPEPTYIRRVIAKGDRFTFQTELAASKEANGWAFQNRNDLYSAAGVGTAGAARGTFPTDAVVMADGSPSTHTQKVIAISKEIAAAESTVLRAFENVVASGKPVTLRFWQKEDRQREQYSNEPFSLTFTSSAPTATEPAKPFSPAKMLVTGRVVMRGTPSDFSGSYNRGNGAFTPVKEARLVGILTRYGKPGSIKAAINLQIEFLDGPSFSPQFHRFDASEAYFEDGRIHTHDLDSHWRWRWAQ